MPGVSADMPQLEFEQTIPPLRGRHTESHRGPQWRRRDTPGADAGHRGGRGSPGWQDADASRRSTPGPAGRLLVGGRRPRNSARCRRSACSSTRSTTTSTRPISPRWRRFQPGSVNLLASAFPALAARIGADEGRPPTGDYRLMRAIRALLSVLAEPDGLVLVLDRR